MGDKKGDVKKIFENFSLGVVSNRDSWCYNFSKRAVAGNMHRMVEFYNAEVQRFNAAYPGLGKKEREAKIDAFIDTDPTSISWTRALKQELAKNRTFAFAAESLTSSLYRPFTKQWLYFNRTFNEMVYQIPRIFPDAAAENLVIMVKQRWAGSGHLALMTDVTQPYS